MGYEHQAVRGGDAAATRLVKTRFDVVITELSLPGMDGFALIEALRARSPRSDTRLVVVSAFVDLRTAASVRRDALGIDAVLARDASAEGVLRALRRVLASPAPSAVGRTTTPETTVAPWRMPALPFDELDVLASDLIEIEDVDVIERAPAFEAREPARLAAIEALGRDDDPEVQRMVDDVAREFGVSTVLASFVLADRQWLKAAHGVSGTLQDERGSTRDVSFCRHVVEADVARPLVVPDAAMHPVFMKNPLVVDGTVRGYVGAPLITSAGHVLGTLCLIDQRPLQVSADDVDRVMLAARRVAGHLELRAATRKAQGLADQLATAVAANAANERSVARWASVLDHVEVGVLLMTPTDRVVVYANEAIGAAFGVPAPSLIGLTRDAFLAGAALLAADLDAFRRAMAVPQTGPFAAQAVIELAQPARRVMRWASRPVLIDGAPLQMSTFTDVTAEADLAVALQRESHVDALTGLLNRRGFDVAVKRELARRRRQGGNLWLAMVDLDHFKAVNDAHGHGAGDDVLRAVARTLSGVLRGADLAVRFGGEELLLVFVGGDAASARAAAERCRAAVAALALPTGPVSISVGVAALEDDVDAAIVAADGRLYAAKAGGRNLVVGPHDAAPTS